MKKEKGKKAKQESIIPAKYILLLTLWITSDNSLALTQYGTILQFDINSTELI